MRLLDLDPRWLTKDGMRIGLLFNSPLSGRPGKAIFRMTAFFAPTPHDDQYDAIVAVVGEDGWLRTQTCNPAAGWTCTPDAQSATFENVSIQPSLDGGPSSWHGYITNGEIVGGI